MQHHGRAWNWGKHSVAFTIWKSCSSFATVMDIFLVARAAVSVASATVLVTVLTAWSKLTVWGKVPWSDFPGRKYSCDTLMVATHNSRMLWIAPPQSIDPETTSVLNFPLPRDKVPIPYPFYSQMYPLLNILLTVYSTFLHQVRFQLLPAQTVNTKFQRMPSRLTYSTRYMSYELFELFTVQLFH